RLTEAELPEHFAGGGNIGVLNGEPSEGIVDGDIDTPEAIAAADAFMPRTALVFGHASNPRSHRTYRCNPPPATRHFKDSAGENGRDETMLCELRSTGSQTIWPPSTHPDGDTYTFDSDGEPAEVDGATLLTAMS